MAAKVYIKPDFNFINEVTHRSAMDGILKIYVLV